jgi:hypothetical protein
VPGACPLDLHVAINILAALTGAPAWDDPDTLWDDAVWRDRERWVDVAPDVTGLTITRADDQAAHLTVELRNTSLRYSQAELDFPIGGLVAVWLDDDWRFYGRITAWTENYPTTPDRDAQRAQATVTIEAFDSVFLLDQQLDGVEYHLGADGDTTPTRIGTLATTAGFQRHLKLDQSAMPHRDQATVNPLYESLLVTAESDGGLIFVDNDGALIYLDRESFLVGRGDHAQPVVTVSGHVRPRHDRLRRRAAPHVRHVDPQRRATGQRRRGRGEGVRSGLDLGQGPSGADVDRPDLGRPDRGPSPGRRSPGPARGRDLLPGPDHDRPPPVPRAAHR